MVILAARLRAVNSEAADKIEKREVIRTLFEHLAHGILQTSRTFATML